MLKVINLWNLGLQVQLTTPEWPCTSNLTCIFIQQLQLLSHVCCLRLQVQLTAPEWPCTSDLMRYTSYKSHHTWSSNLEKTQPVLSGGAGAADNTRVVLHFKSDANIYIQ